MEAATIAWAYRRLRSEYHPDRGGDPDKFIEVQAAYDNYLEQHA
jgi:DnaJ-class molecular chaperone